MYDSRAQSLSDLINLDNSEVEIRTIRTKCPNVRTTRSLCMHLFTSFFEITIQIYLHTDFISSQKESSRNGEDDALFIVEDRLTNNG